MIKVKNKKVIGRLSKSSFKANKLRNLFAIIAIVLTTVLFTSVFTIGMNLIKSFEEATMRQVGTSAHGGFKYITIEEYERLKAHPLIKEIAYSVVLGMAENKELEKRQTEIRYLSNDREAELMFSKPTTGKLPTAYKEVALDTITLDAFGLPYKLGQEINLEYSLNGEKRSDTFTLVGFWEGDRIMNASQVWLSQDYVKEQLKDFDPQKNDKMIGVINADFNFKNSRNIEGKINKIIVDSGYRLDEIATGINWAYLGGNNSLDSATILGALSGLLLIIFCGYLIISNIFLISISKDIRFYGLLKTIGTTSKQIRALIRKQALSLCMMGIPIGLLLGYFIGVLLTPMVMSILNTYVKAISISPLIFIGSGIFAIVTVLISIRKPAKIASKVSPIEALRNTESRNSKKVSSKSGGTNLAKMGFANVFRNRKKAILVMISLSLSLIILNITVSIVNSFDIKKYLSSKIDCDFMVTDIGFGNFSTDFWNKQTLSPMNLEDILAQKGIESMGTVYFSEIDYPVDDSIKSAVEKGIIQSSITEDRAFSMREAIDYGMSNGHLYGIDQFAFEKLEIFEGEADYKKFKGGDYVIVSTFDRKGTLSYYSAGEKVQLDFGNGETKEYEVLAVGNIPYSFSSMHFHPVDPNFILPKEEYVQQKREQAPMIALFDVEDIHEPTMEKFLEAYCGSVNKELKYQSRAVFIKEFENLKKTYMTVGGILSFVMAFIGIMNFTNTMITSVISRRRELAMLQSMGMTKVQMRKLLIFEGLTYTGLTAIFTLSIGWVIGHYGINLMAKGMYILTANFNVTPTLLCLPILVALAILVPVFCCKLACKDSLVERLREIE